MRSRTRTRSTLAKLIAAVAIAAVASPVVPAAAAPSADRNPVQVTIDGRTFGPEHGLVIEETMVTLSRPREFTTLGDLFYKYWGSSYVRSYHSLEVRYTGTAYAAANVYQGQRIIQVCFQYRRGGSNLIPWTCSNATSNGSSWSPGPIVSATVYGTLDPNAPVTTFHYSTYRIDPGIVRSSHIPAM